MGNLVETKTWIQMVKNHKKHAIYKGEEMGRRGTIVKGDWWGSENIFLPT